METRDIIALIGLIFTLLGGIFAIYQWYKGNKIRQAEFVRQIIEKLRFDKDIANTMAIIEYSKSWYPLYKDREFHNNESGIECEIDALLSYLTYVCYLYNSNIISKKEFCILEYGIKRVCSNEQTQAYLWNLYQWTKHINTKSSFNILIEYLRNKVLTSDENNRFESSDSKVSGYVKRLNF